MNLFKPYFKKQLRKIAEEKGLSKQDAKEYVNLFEQRQTEIFRKVLKKGLLSVMLRKKRSK